MTGEYVYLNKNEYTKDGERRCYASFADVNGNVINFNASAVNSSFPEAFSVCQLDFQVQQFGQGRTAFILERFDIVGKLVEKK